MVMSKWKNCLSRQEPVRECWAEVGVPVESSMCQGPGAGRSFQDVGVAEGRGWRQAGACRVGTAWRRGRAGRHRVKMGAQCQAQPWELPHTEVQHEDQMQLWHLVGAGSRGDQGIHAPLIRSITH